MQVENIVTVLWKNRTLFWKNGVEIINICFTSQRIVPSIFQPSFSYFQSKFNYDVWEEWPDGHCRFVYPESCEEAKKHSSGWAMRNTNNHNVNILKKSCLGVLVCTKRCIQKHGKPVTIRPAICDKARKKQQGKAYSNLKTQTQIIFVNPKPQTLNQLLT